MAKILKDRTKQTIMDAIRSDMPLSYQARIPAATQAGVKNTAEQLFNYRPMLNEFVDALVHDREPEVSGKEALTTMRTIFGSIRSSDIARPVAVNTDFVTHI